MRVSRSLILRIGTVALASVVVIGLIGWHVTAEFREFMFFQTQIGQLKLLNWGLSDCFDTKGTLPSRVCGGVNDISWRGRMSEAIVPHGHVPNGFPDIALVAEDNGVWCSDLPITELRHRFGNPMIFIFIPVAISNRHKNAERIRWSVDSPQITVWSHDSGPMDYPLSVLRNAIGLRLDGSTVHVQPNEIDSGIMAILKGDGIESY